MSRSHKDGHGRCTLCGDAAENCGRRQRDALGLDAIPDGLKDAEEGWWMTCCPCEDGCPRCDPSFGEGDDWELSGDGPLKVALIDVAKVS